MAQFFQENFGGKHVIFMFQGLGNKNQFLHFFWLTLNVAQSHEGEK